VQFLDPIFLAGLMAAGIPILLHFLQRRRTLKIPFAPLRFLRPTQERQMQRMNLHRLLLLLLRVAIIVCVVMALARPTLTGGLASLMRGGDSSSVVLLVDSSASLLAQTSSGTVFDAAREEAKILLDQLGDQDEVSIVLYDDVARPLFEEFLRSPSLLAEELDTAQARPRVGDPLVGLDAALDQLERGRQDHREIYLFSDFQRSALDSTQLAVIEERLARGDATNLYLRPVATEPFVNRSVQQVQLPATLIRPGQTAEISVVLRQDGNEELREALLLSVDASSVGETELAIAAHGQGRHVFPLTLATAKDLGLSVRLRPDRYALDDELFQVLPVTDQVPVLLLRGILSAEGERDPALFLTTALDPLGDGRGSFAVDVTSAASFDVLDLPNYPVIIGSDLRDIGAARLAALRDYVDGGGTLLLFAGDPRVGSYLNEKLLPTWTPLRLGAFRGSEQTFERLEITAADHPIFDGLETEALQTLTEAQLQGFYRLDEADGEVLVRFAGGGGAVVELTAGRGRILVCGFDTSTSAGDLPWSPMFLPLVQRMSGYLATAGWGRNRRQFQVGEALSVEAGATSGVEYTVLIPDGTRRGVRLDASRVPARAVLDEVSEPGLYTFAANGDDFATVAVNVSRVESRREFTSADEFAAALGLGDRVSVRSLQGAQLDEVVREARQGRPIHRWFFAAAFALLLLEGLVSRRVISSTPS
jgi:Aerotolerance regulator N-terminal/von Willebrand factor type A domain